MDWKQARNHAERLADDGYEVALHVGAQPDPLVERVWTIRIARLGIPSPEALAALFADAKNSGLALREFEIGATSTSSSSSRLASRNARTRA